MMRARISFVPTLLLLLTLVACVTDHQIAVTATPMMEVSEPTITSPSAGFEIPAASLALSESTPDLVATPIPLVPTKEYQTNVDDLGEGVGESINFVSVQGDLLLVGDSSGTLTLMDIVDPTLPRALVNLDLGTELDPHVIGPDEYIWVS